MKTKTTYINIIFNALRTCNKLFVRVCKIAIGEFIGHPHILMYCNTIVSQHGSDSMIGVSTSNPLVKFPDFLHVIHRSIDLSEDLGFKKE